MNMNKVIDYLKKRPLRTIELLFLLLYFTSYFALREMHWDENIPKAHIQVRIHLPYSLAAMHKIYLPLCMLEAYVRYGSIQMYVGTNSGLIYLY